jgi:glycosyltransferase involved in cell wall biosynthesis
MIKSIKILFLVPYPLDCAPSQRFRFEQYFEVLKENNVSFDCQSFIDEQTWKILYKKGYFLRKTLGILKGFLRRLYILLFLKKYDFVFIHREAAPIFPPFFEFVIAQVLGKKIIYDFDDAIWLPNTSSQNRISAFVKFHQKVGLICSWSYKISAGNDYLCEYARLFNPQVILNPTTIDTNHHKGIKRQQLLEKEKIVIGWTGSHSTLKYLTEIESVIQEIAHNHSFSFLVISNQKPDNQIDNLVFQQWNKASEIQDLLRIHIGIMPLTDDEWAKGKCGFKALQYMSLGIPALASPVGVNTKIITNGENGFLCNTPQEWKEKLILLIENESLRIELGKKAQQTVEEYYSVKSNRDNFLNLFR